MITIYALLTKFLCCCCHENKTNWSSIFWPNVSFPFSLKHSPASSTLFQVPDSPTSSDNSCHQVEQRDWGEDHHVKKSRTNKLYQKGNFFSSLSFILVAACRRCRCRRLFCRLQMKSLFSVFLPLLFCWLSLYRLLRLTLEKSSGREQATIGRKLNKDLLEKNGLFFFVSNLNAQRSLLGC